MKTWKKILLKEWWNNNLDYLPLGAKFRGQRQKNHTANIIRELDERRIDIDVAKKVFGYEINIGESTEYHEYGGQTEYPELQYVKEVHKNGSWDGKSDWKEWEPLPHYSTDIKDAFMIVEKLKNPITYITMGTDANNRYWCEMYGDDLNTALPTRDTISLAICAAALTAKGFNET